MDVAKQNIFFSGAEKPERLREYMNKNGFLVFKNVLSSVDIAQCNNFFESNSYIRDCLKIGNAEVLPGGAHIVNGCETIIVQEKLIELLKNLIDYRLTFTSHSDFHSGKTSGWHKDDGKGSYFRGLGDYFSDDECRVYKVAIYLQDCSVEGGLTVKPGSHKTKSVTVGEDLYLNTNIGDVIIFDVRLSHSGWAPARSRYGNFLRKILKKVRIIEQFEHIPFQRKSIFFTFGDDNHYTQAFAHNNMKRQIKQCGRDISVIPAALRRALQDKDVHHYY